MKLSAPLKFVLIIVAVIIVVGMPGWFFGKPIPYSVASVYVILAAVAALLALTATDDGAREFKELIEEQLRPEAGFLRKAMVLLPLPLLLGYAAYKSVENEEGLRIVHPAPPSVIWAYGKEMRLGKIVNPYRALQKTNSEEFKKITERGSIIYFKNCFFCHGAKLDGNGQYAAAFNPRPLPFTGKDTIAQLSESYVFWRVVKGGQGLPREGHPWTSAMPAWEGTLSEEEAWQVITFLYERTGNVPREWK